MLFDVLLERQQAIEAGIEAIGVHLRNRHAEQFFQRGAAIPGVLDVQLAGRLAEARDGEDGGDGGPGHLLTTVGQQPGQERVQAQQSPQSPGEPDVAEVAQPFEPNAFELNEDFLVGLLVLGRIEERRLRLLLSAQSLAQVRPAVLLTGLEFAEVGDDALA